jgi:hypothetical protein
MTTKPIFVNQVTNVPVDWANNISALVYDVFGVATTLDGARKRLGMSGMAYQDSTGVNIKGGSINGTVIGDEAPATGRFSRLTLTSLVPGSPAEATSKQYVDHSIVFAINALGLQNMATQRSNAVQITGGSAIFDRLRSRANPEQPYDAVTLKYYNDTKPRIRQALTPMSVGPDNRTVTTPFKTVPGAMVLFVDQTYQIPDQYEITGENQIRFLTDLPAGAVVGGFCISSDT